MKEFEKVGGISFAIGTVNLLMAVITTALGYSMFSTNTGLFKFIGAFGVIFGVPLLEAEYIVKSQKVLPTR